MANRWNPHNHLDSAHRCHIHTGTGLTAATSAPRPGSPLRRVRRHLPYPYHISSATRFHRCQTCVGTWRTATTSIRTRAQCCHICTGTQMWQHWDSAYRCHISSLSRLTESTRVPGPGTPLPLVRRYSAHLRLVCVSTRFASTAFAPQLGSLLPPLHRTWTHRCDICSVTRLAAATFAPRLGSPLPHLHLDWAHCHTCTGAGLAAGTSLPGLGSLLPHMCQTRPNAGLITQCCLRVSDHPSRCQRCGLDQISPELACGEICQVAHICQRPRHVCP